MHDRMEDDEEEGEAVRAATESTAGELESLVSELGQWRSYFDLVHGLHGWDRSYAQYKQRDGATGEQREELIRDAKSLLTGLTEQLLKSGWLGWLGDPASVLAEEEGDGGPVGIELTLTSAAASVVAGWEGGNTNFPHLKVGRY